MASGQIDLFDFIFVCLCSLCGSKTYFVEFGLKFFFSTLKKVFNNLKKVEGLLRLEKA